jgi:hypothetical protein
MAASRDSPHLSIVLGAPKARVDDIGYAAELASQIQLLQKEGLHLMAGAG